MRCKISCVIHRRRVGDKLCARRKELEMGWRGLRTNLETHAEALARCCDWLEQTATVVTRNVGLGQLWSGDAWLDVGASRMGF